jgi:hypothetical protein
VGGEFLTIDNFIHIFFTNSMQVEQVGGHYSLQCLEKEFDPSTNKAPSNCKIGRIEIWAPDRYLAKRKIKSAGDDNQEIQVSKKNPFYDKYSPLNFFNRSMIFEVSKSLPLAHIAHEVFGEQKQFLRNGEHIVASTSVSENASQGGITAVSYQNLEK